MAEPGGLHPSLDDIGVLRELETPCYVYDPVRAQADYADLQRALGTALIVSIKANPNPDLLAACVAGFTDGIELASQRELDSVLRYRVPKFVNTPALNPNLLRAAVAAQATVVLDNLYQVDMVIAQSRALPLLPLILRLNAGELVGDLDRRGPGDRFGMSVADVIEAGRRLCAAGIPLHGLHVFAGSQMFARAAWRLIERLTQMLPEIEQAVGRRIGFINLGGGIPPEWRALTFDFRAYRDALAPLRDNRVLAHESGRAVFTDCGAFVTRTLSRKRLNGHEIVACDGGMVHSFQLAQTELPIKLHRSPKLVYADPAPRARAAGPVLFVGNTCSNMDRIGRLEAGGPLPEPGDYCIFDATGAYFATYTVAGFLGLPPARTYIVPGLFGTPATRVAEAEASGSVPHGLQMQ